MREDKPIEQMFQEILQSLEDWKMSGYAARNYYYEGICPIRTYYDDAGRTLYDEAFTESIVIDIQQKYADGIVSKCVCKSVRKLAKMMKQYDTGFQWNRLECGSKEDLSHAYYTDLLKGFRDDEFRIGLRVANTISGNVTNIRHFFHWLEEIGKETLEQITLKDVGEFLTYFGEQKSSSMGRMLGSLRQLCAFIERQNVPSIDISPALYARPASRSRIRPFFTQLEANEILSSIDTETSIGKRDYAILIIAKELGVRSGDIGKLKLSDIAWEKNEIRFRQSKTGAELVLPLEPIVGNAIADYILHGRPQTEDHHIFIRARAPYKKMTHMFDILKKYAPRDKYGKFSGFHSFRRGIASQMLNVGVSADTVKGILGHTKIDSLKPYARISGVRLKSCAISLAGIETTREVLQ